MEILAFAALFRLPCHLEQHPRFLFRVSGIENCAAGDQQIRACFDHRGDGIVGHPPIDLDSEVQIEFSPERGQLPDLVQ